MEHHVHNCCHKREVKRGLWSIEEDQKLIDYINNNGYKNWSLVPTYAGLQRCGKSCRLRWLNYLRPDVKLGNFTEDETKRIMQLHKILGNKWAKIAKYLPGRTDNEVKNYWNTTIKKRLMRKKNRETFGNTPTTTVVAPHVAPSVAPMSVGGTTGGSENNNNNNLFSYPSSSFSFAPNLVSFSNTITTSPRPPPPPPSDNPNTLLQEFGSFSHPPPPPPSDNPNTLLRGFGPFSNSSTNNYQMNFNAQVSIPEVAIPTPSIVETPPPIQSTWASNNNYYPLNFNQVTQEENYAPFTFPDITGGGSSSVYRPILDENFPSFPPMNYQDSLLLMTANPATINNNNVTIDLTSDDDGIELLESMMSPYVPLPSTSSSASPFLEERLAHPNASLWSFNHDVPVFDSVYPLF